MIGKPRIKNPIAAFTKCPSCLQSMIRPIGFHVYCNWCGWDSIQAYTDAGGYDQCGDDEIFNPRAQR